MTARATPAENVFPQHGLLQSALLHIALGALTAAAFVALKPLIGSGGAPPLLAFQVAMWSGGNETCAW